ncbi:unnamed protein product [Allacma fusca]|uniref:Helicase-associated domain-containing protein n=1 Tax=Allacma fusca TaxID=39272 RepID=A0A8J2JF02_9HEXA|nr:unnamed protein product [Allacma fusca]
MQRLKEFWISKASAEQRKGRAGRTGPGVCYRLYAEAEYQELQAYSTPEIQRVPLDSLLLQMIALGIPDCRKFPFIEPPTLESIESSIMRLKEQAALTEDEKLTPIGQTLSQLPVDVTIGKMLIMGTVFDHIDAVLSLAAALSVQSPFTNWAHRDPDCVAARKTLDSDHGDPLTLLNAYRAWLEEKADSNSNSKKWCKKRGFEEQRFYEMTKLRQQFKSLLTDSKLIKDTRADTANMSSQERSLRHGELKQLRMLKKEFHQTVTRKKKILKLSEGDYIQENEDELEDDEIDIRDVEFRMRNDSREVKNLLHQSTPYGYEDLTMLKVILASGLYPQLGIPDDFNKYKSDADQMFHTRGKGFTVLHPMSIFANQPDVLKLNESDIIMVQHMNTKLPIASKHQILFFLTLLETNKPYLMNTFRMPAIQTLLLFAHSIDTDPTFTRIVFDSWIEVEFADAAAARTMIITSFELRNAWTQLLARRLSQGEEPLSKLDTKQGRELGFGLVSFLRSEAFYTIKRLLAADQKDLYDRHFNPFMPDAGINFEADWDISVNALKGGVSLASFFTYGCLYGEIPDPDEWVCPVCSLNIMASPLELLLHQAQCRLTKLKESESQFEEEELKARPFSKAYYCNDCSKHLHLTPIEILRHKKSHQAGGNTVQKIKS